MQIILKKEGRIGKRNDEKRGHKIIDVWIGTEERGGVSQWRIY